MFGAVVILATFLAPGGIEIDADQANVDPPVVAGGCGDAAGATCGALGHTFVEDDKSLHGAYHGVQWGGAIGLVVGVGSAVGIYYFVARTPLAAVLPMFVGAAIGSVVGGIVGGIIGHPGHKGTDFAPASCVRIQMTPNGESMLF